MQSSQRYIYITEADESICLADDAFKGCGNITVNYFGSKSLYEKCTRTYKDEFKKNLNVKYYCNHKHNFDTSSVPSCTEKETVKVYCSCGDSHNIKANGTTAHKYGKWKTVKKPTLSKKGKKQRVCVNCGKKQSKSIKKLVDVSKLNIKFKKETASNLHLTYFNANPVEPMVVVKNGKTTLSEGKHYKIRYKNNTNIGSKAQAIITGIEKNGYVGKKVITFTIRPASPSIKNQNKPKKIKATKSTVTLSWKKSDAATGYIIYKKTDKGFVEIARTKKLTYKVKNLKPNKKYTFSVGAYTKVGKEIICSKINNSVTVTTKRK